MLATATIVLDRFDMVRVTFIVENEVVGHDVVGIFDNVPIHLDLTTEHLPLLKVNVLQKFLPVLTLSLRLDDLVDNVSEYQRPLDLLSAKVLDKLPPELAATGAIDFDL